MMSDKPSYPGNTIMVRPNGPLICASESNVIVQDTDGNVLQQDKELALCRCGHSANKPFCDGSHKRKGFEAGQTFVDDRSEQGIDTQGDLVISVKENAMLLIKSPVTIFSRDGKSVTTRSKGALCRCGHSAKKPFCDVAHKKCGFSG